MSATVERSRWVELEEFVEARYGSLLRVAFLLTGDPQDAEDLLQEALVRSWAYASGSRIEQPGAFIRRSMVNLYISRWRRRGKVREEPLVDPSLLGAVAGDGANEIVERDEVWRALADLPRHQRAILVLRFYEDLTETQIAEVLGVGVGAVRSGGWRGLQRLRVATGAEPPFASTLIGEDHDA